MGLLVGNLVLIIFNGHYLLVLLHLLYDVAAFELAELDDLIVRALQFLLPELQFLPKDLDLFFLVFFLLEQALRIDCILMVVLVTAATLRHLLYDVHEDFELLLLHGTLGGNGASVVPIVRTFRLLIIK